MIWKINPSTRTEDKKEKQTSSGGWRLKQEVSPHWRVRALLRGPESRSGEGGTQADPERLLLTEGGEDAGTMGRCPRCSGQGDRRAE